ncbi:MAG: hypothetical protein AAGI01_15985, partial [Myxococcota bacterium]
MSEEILRLQEVLEGDPSNHEAFERLGALYQEGRKWRSLVELYEGFEPTNGAAEDPSASLSGLVRGLRDISMDLSDKRDKGELLVALGDVYMKLGLREDAMTAYQESFKTYPKDTTCLRRARRIYMEGGDYERVIVLYELEAKVLKKVKKREQLAGAYLEMAELYGTFLNNKPKAFEMVLAAQEAYPEVQGVELEMVRYSGSEEVAQRVHVLVEQALDLEDVNPRSAARLFVSAARLEHARQGGDLSDAHEYLERAIALDDDNQDAKATLDQILEMLRAGGSGTSADVAAQEEEEDFGEGEGAVVVVGAVMLNEDYVAEDEEQAQKPELEEGGAQSDPYELEELPTAFDEDSEDDVITKVIENYDLELLERASNPQEQGDEAHSASKVSDDKATKELSPEELAAVRAADEAHDASAFSGDKATKVLSPEELAAVHAADEAARADEVAADELEEKAAEEEEETPAPTSSASASPVPEPSGEPLDDDALAAARAALKKDPANLELLEPVQSELILRQDWRELAGVLEKSVKRLRKKDGEYDVMRTLAFVAWRELDDTKLAENYYKRLRRQDDVFVPEVDEFYEEYYAARGDFIQDQRGLAKVRDNKIVVRRDWKADSDKIKGA